jgi:GNAT superfamily N-acetyltransferase
MNTTRVDQYWRETFGLPADEYLAPGVIVCPHSARLAGRDGAWVFLRDATCVISAPPALVEQVRDAARGIPLGRMLSEEALRRLFGDCTERTVGPSYQGYAEGEDFRPVANRHVRRLSPAEHDALCAFLSASTPGEKESSGIDPHGDPLFGFFFQSRLVAAAGVIPWAAYAANPGVLVRPGHRGRGFGTAVASAAMAHVLSEGKVVLFQTLLSNRAAVAMAGTLGCRPYAEMMYVALRTGGVGVGGP